MRLHQLSFTSAATLAVLLSELSIGNASQKGLCMEALESWQKPVEEHKRVEWFKCVKLYDLLRHSSYLPDHLPDPLPLKKTDSDYIKLLRPINRTDGCNSSFVHAAKRDDASNSQPCMEVLDSFQKIDGDHNMSRLSACPFLQLSLRPYVENETKHPISNPRKMFNLTLSKAIDCDQPQGPQLCAKLTKSAKKDDLIKSCSTVSEDNERNALLHNWWTGHRSGNARQVQHEVSCMEVLDSYQKNDGDHNLSRLSACPFLQLRLRPYVEKNETKHPIPDPNKMFTLTLSKAIDCDQPQGPQFCANLTESAKRDDLIKSCSALLNYDERDAELRSWWQGTETFSRATSFSLLFSLQSLFLCMHVVISMSYARVVMCSPRSQIPSQSDRGIAIPSQRSL